MEFRNVSLDFSIDYNLSIFRTFSACFLHWSNKVRTNSTNDMDQRKLDLKNHSGPSKFPFWSRKMVVLNFVEANCINYQSIQKIFCIDISESNWLMFTISGNAIETNVKIMMGWAHTVSKFGSIRSLNIELKNKNFWALDEERIFIRRTISTSFFGFLY